MAKNFKQPGDVVNFIAPTGGVTGGSLVIIGSLALIPTFSAAENERCTGCTGGIYTLPKAAANTPAQFAKAYWDNTAKNVTTTASGNTLIGVFDDAYANGTTEAGVRLNGVSI